MPLPDPAFGEVCPHGTLARQCDLCEAQHRVAELEAYIRQHNLVDEHGNPRKILGTLPVTKDGCVAGLGSTLWRWNKPAKEMMRLELFHADSRSHLIEPIPSRATICVELCYSTRSAAEAAARGAGGGA